jgi:hypothetical protein
MPTHSIVDVTLRVPSGDTPTNDAHTDDVPTDNVRTDDVLTSAAMSETAVATTVGIRPLSDAPGYYVYLSIPGVIGAPTLIVRTGLTLDEARRLRHNLVCLLHHLGRRPPQPSCGLALPRCGASCND